MTELGQESRSTTEPDEGSRPISRRRLIGVDVLIGITTLLLIVAMFSVWANRLLFNPDNWANTSTQLLQNADIRSDDRELPRRSALRQCQRRRADQVGPPPRLQPLAAPAAGALRNAAVQGDRAGADAPARPEPVGRSQPGGRQDIHRGGQRRKGRGLGQPGRGDAEPGRDPRQRRGPPGPAVNLASKLPPNIANLTIFKSDQLKTVQNGGKAIKGLALWLTILCPLLYALAVFLAPRPPPADADDRWLRGDLRGRRGVLRPQHSPDADHQLADRRRVAASRDPGHDRDRHRAAGRGRRRGHVHGRPAGHRGVVRRPRPHRSGAREAIAPFLRDSPGGPTRSHSACSRSCSSGTRFPPPGHRPGSSRSRCSGCSPPPSCASRPSASFPTRGMAPQHTRSGRACPACAAIKTRSTARPPAAVAPAGLGRRPAQAAVRPPRSGRTDRRGVQGRQGPAAAP